MPRSISDDTLEQLRAAVDQLDAAAARAGTLCARCRAAQTLSVETAKEQVMQAVRKLLIVR